MLRGHGRITADTLTDAQANHIIKGGNFPNLIMTLAEYKEATEEKVKGGKVLEEDPKKKPRAKK